MQELYQFIQTTGFLNINPGGLLMIAAGMLFVWLGIKKDFEPLLLVPIGFGIVVGNMPGIAEQGLAVESQGSVLNFLYFATDTQRLADQAKWIAYGPARASSQPLVEASMAPYMPTNPANMQNYLINNIEGWADNQDEVEAKFQAWLAK